MRKKILWSLIVIELKKVRKYITFFVFLMIDMFFITGNISATIVHIPADYSTIQEGVDSADSGDTVLVAKGTYSGGIDMKNGVYLKSEDGPDSTIISGGESVIRCDSLIDTVTIDGFTICNSYDDAVFGGGIGSRNSNVIIKNNIIRDNTIYPYQVFYAAGGGIYIKGGSALIENNIIRNNKAEGDWKMSIEGHSKGGGGIYAESAMVTIYSNVIGSNSAWGGSWCGGGVSCIECFKAVIFNNLIDSNDVARQYGLGKGAGIYCTPPVTIINNTIANNNYYDTSSYSYGDGAGIYCEKDSAGQDSIIIRDNIIAFNMAGDSGTGGIFCSDSLNSSKILISWNDFYLNIQGDFYNVPPGVGDFSYGVNRNSISCDSFYNINIDPGFASGPRGNYYQQYVIDCGDYIVGVGQDFSLAMQGMSNTPDGNPDTGWVDLGYHYQAGIGIEEENPKSEARNPKLEASPNPFVNSAIIRLEDSKIEDYKIQVYDMGGRLVEETGKSVIGKNLQAGIYFIKTNGYTPVKIVKLGRVR